MMSGLCKRIGILAFLLSAVAIVNANASLGGRSTTNNRQPTTTTKQQQPNNNNQPQQPNNNQPQQPNNNNQQQQNNNIKTTAKKGSQEVTVKSVTIKMGSSYRSGGFDISVKLEPNPNPSGKSCEVKFGEMSTAEKKTQIAPATCEDLQLTTTSQIKVQVLSTDDNKFIVDYVKVDTTNGGFDVEFPNDWILKSSTGEKITRRGK